MTKAPLTGKLFDANGKVMSPSFSRGRSDRVYRYYVSTSLQRGAGKSDNAVVRRLPATAIESIIFQTAARWMPQERTPVEQIKAIRIVDGGLTLDCPAEFADDLARRLSAETALRDRVRYGLACSGPHTPRLCAGAL